MYDEKKLPHKVPLESLPVKLPEINKFHNSGNPLEQIEEWKKSKC